MKRSQRCGGILTGLAFFAAALSWHAEAGGGKLEKSDSKVKATATATKAGADGKQTVTITLDVVKGWHLYANPVNNEILDDNRTTVKIAAKEKVKVDVKYPAGKTIADKKEKYDIYEGVVKIQAYVVRTMGDTSPLEINIAVSACDSKVCLLPGTVKLRVP
jgi:hypothetical protein